MTAPTRNVGRPRDPKCDEAIVDATLHLLAEGGYTALTMEAVAARAAVGKATLYRRYPNKQQLVVEALSTLTEQPEPDSGRGVRDELVGLLDALRRRPAQSLAGRIFPRLVGEGVDNPELLASYRQQVIAPRRARFAAVLRRGMDEGLLRADLDVEHALDLLIGPMAYRNLLRADEPPRDLAARIVDDVLRGLHA